MLLGFNSYEMSCFKLLRLKSNNLMVLFDVAKRITFEEIITYTKLINYIKTIKM